MKKAIIAVLVLFFAVSLVAVNAYFDETHAWCPYSGIVGDATTSNGINVVLERANRIGEHGFVLSKDGRKHVRQCPLFWRHGHLPYGLFGSAWIKNSHDVSLRVQKYVNHQAIWGQGVGVLTGPLRSALALRHLAPLGEQRWCRRPLSHCTRHA